jgi:hypothetical protein
VSDLLQDGLAFLAEEMKDHVSTTVTYRRGRLGTAATVDLAATLGSTLFTLDELEGQRRTFTSIDFDVQAEDLTWGSELRTPERGDLIILDDRVYEVYSPTGERHWKWLSGLIGVRLRVHTKLVGTE